MITVRIPDDFHKQLKIKAIHKQTSLQAVVNDALKKYLETKEK